LFGGRDTSSLVDAYRTISLPRGRSLLLDRPLVMGILNVTPDSFYPHSRVLASEESAEPGVLAARAMIQAGADVLDIGGESTRPGSAAVADADERARVVPLIQAIRRESDIPISIDTRKLSVARAAVDAGADIINDVSGLRDEPELASYTAEHRLPVVIMHMRGTPATMQRSPHYEDVVAEVSDELRRLVAAAGERGVAPEQIIIDPGIGFGKRFSDNIDLINGIPSLAELGYPVLIGLSRKAFLGSVGAAAEENQLPVEERLAPTLAATVIAVLKGADIVRVHDVTETVRAVRTVGAFRDGMA
jgi:dihydropteroate synthase